ncbi:MAG: molybdopterin-synthase adenylyltransferase MoeB [Gemmatimonadetes bacterium]|nr:molybdopterin-synthase adenylyltransferase MoeB [Gemmatimonadota bacterium]
MGVTIRIPTPLRACTAGHAEVSVEGGSVGEALAALVAEHPRIRRHLFGEDGRLRGFVNVYVNEEDVRAREGVNTPLADGDTLVIVPSIAGGSGAPAVGSASAQAEGVPAQTGSGPELSRLELARYARHLALEEVGIEGQRRLKAARVLVVGAGGLGSPVALYLAAAGVGTIGLVDFDEVDATNLQRQILYGVSDVGRPKTEAAAARLADLNPHVRVVRHDGRLTRESALDVVAGYDVVVDGTDNFPTRYLVNDACVLLGKPYVYGSILRFEGQVSVFWGARGPCYRCLFREPPPPGLVPSCAEGGVLGVLPGIIGTLQALEALKLILGRGETLVGRLVLFDALAFQFRELKLRKAADCPICGENPTITELIDYDFFCGVVPETPSSDPDAAFPAELTPAELKARLDRGERVQLVDVREPFEWEIASLAAYGARLIPLGELGGRLAELDPEGDVVVYCLSGARSAAACRRLRAAGFRRVANLAGGIRAWTDQIDPSLARY